MTTHKPNIRHEDAIIHAQQCAEAYTDACTAVREAFEELERAVAQLEASHPLGPIKDLQSEMVDECVALDWMMPERVVNALDDIRRWKDSQGDE